MTLIHAQIKIHETYFLKSSEYQPREIINQNFRKFIASTAFFETAFQLLREIINQNFRKVIASTAFF